MYSMKNLHEVMALLYVATLVVFKVINLLAYHLVDFNLVNINFHFHKYRCERFGKNSATLNSMPTT